MNLETVMNELYASEINCEISCFWDGGWDVKLGDAMNGFVATTSCSTLPEVAAWLHAEAIKAWPTSGFATKHPLRGEGQ